MHRWHPGQRRRLRARLRPWVTISPNGNAYLMSLSVDQDPNAVGDFNPDAMLVSRSTDGGLTWSNPSSLIRDANPRRFNDKNSITADPNDSSFVYAVWDRLSAIGPVFRGPTLFTRTTNGGRSWEEARVIYDPGAFAQTLGNQIAVRPQGELINIFTLIRNVRRPGDPLSTWPSCAPRTTAGRGLAPSGSRGW